ncbi:MAG: hypothetical protein B6D35_13285 [Candidatus Brocadia sp. UTAMX2]|jgi:hypothetical protein|nr:MAG: hypothetical protein B6D35_13285 [Candidatus Brocadia sp. UTAMX2]
MSLTQQINLTTQDWDGNLGGWIFSLARVPDSTIEAVYIKGEMVNQDHYKVDYDVGVVRWRGNDKRPSTIALKYTLPDNFASKKQVDKWRKYAVILPFVGTVLGIIATLLVTYFEPNKKRLSPSLAPITFNQRKEFKTIYLTYPLTHSDDTKPLVDNIKAQIAESGYKCLIPPDGKITAESLKEKLSLSTAVIALYIPVKGTVWKTDVGGNIIPQIRHSAWIDTTVGAARISNTSPMRVLAIQDKRIEVFGLARTESFVYQRAFDTNDSSTLEAIRGEVKRFLEIELK